ncbi:MAG TPA: alpha/beta fold hydrolase, partial [Tepidiformaceae bacterium]|nr:alpha/beta fold hydrolase [Tepidiformaceae bacterium]
HDVASHALDLHALVREILGHERVVVVGGDLGGPVIQDLSLRYPGFVERMVLFNSPLPFDKEKMAGMNTRPAREASDYFV